MSALQRAAAAAAPRLPLARSRVPEVCALERERLGALLEAVNGTGAPAYLGAYSTGVPAGRQ